MNKQTLRTLGLGFMCAAILTGAFAVFGQGHVPIAGVTVNSLFNQNNSNDAELSQYRDAVSQLQNEKASLESERQSLREQVSKMQESQTTTVSTTVTSETTETTTSKPESTEPATTGTFTINEGEASSEIANRLEAEGYISSATELQDLISYWNLDSMIVAGSYELNSDMSVHQIAEAITNGAYYYIP